MHNSGCKHANQKIIQKKKLTKKKLYLFTNRIKRERTRRTAVVAVAAAGRYRTHSKKETAEVFFLFCSALLCCYRCRPRAMALLLLLLLLLLSVSSVVRYTFNFKWSIVPQNASKRLQWADGTEYTPRNECKRANGRRLMVANRC